MDKTEIMKRCIIRALAINSELNDDELEKVAYEFWDEEIIKQAKQEKAKEIFNDLEDWLFKEGDVSSWEDFDEYKQLKKKHLGKENKGDE